MRKTVIAIWLGLSLALLPVAVSVMSPSPAQAAQAERARGGEPDPGMVILDAVVVRPLSFVWVVGAYITYPVALLLDPLFNDDPERLKREWIDKPSNYTFERPLGVWGRRR